MTYLDHRNKIILETTDRRSNAKKWTNPRMYSRNVEVELFLSLIGRDCIHRFQVVVARNKSA